ncbi:MAG: hypothetical protein DME04_14215 [Candidatus Rokuibacteriota bacterium]|nr:MAG: hypothetical protein DME04_14215 [Candidatus Rokubacteria bacterium]
MCRAPAALVLVAMIALAACAGRRIENGIYHSPKGYRVALPSPAWVVAEASRADLELRHHGGGAAMLANAECDERSTARSGDLLLRQLLIGIRDRATITREEVSLNGRRAVHRVLDGRLASPDEPTRIEAYVMKDERCVYDFVYVAPPPSFESWRPDFLRFVESFEKERAD